MFRLGTYPTPIEPAGNLWIKRDDQIAPAYGGNKVRKLERLLDDARRRDAKRLVTIGAAGSHQIVATAIYGAAQRFEVEAVVVAQPASDHAKKNLRVALAHGLRPIVATSWAAAPSLVTSLVRRDAYLIPLGGSNALGTLGFVDAAKELAAQIEAGAMPEPDVIVVPLGSGGTAAGLAIGLEAAGLRARVAGVAISSPLRLVEELARRMVRKTAPLAGVDARRALERLVFDRRWLGRGYGYSTRDAERAIAEAARHGLTLDATYTAKAYAAALERANEGARVLYWHTLSSAPLDDAAPLPADLERLFR
ncbi:MAG: pyridoxal-phosphate dependent enzyme [Labilithrix sp.]|nr:pyridoxal-phosphate dependent enzyme [Labilithrix sp.]MCW5813092.1 pyridoxal-phosphate dependent enzyme [Labilithrix sp.]